MSKIKTKTINDDPIVRFLGKIVSVDLINGRGFGARLIAMVPIGGNDFELWFQRTDGTEWMHKRSSIANIELVRTS